MLTGKLEESDGVEGGTRIGGMQGSIHEVGPVSTTLDMGQHPIGVSLDRGIQEGRLQGKYDERKLN